MEKRIKKSIIFKAENGTTYNFKECYNILHSFYRKTGKTLYFIGANDVFDGHPIGQIVKFLREKHKEHALTLEKIEALERMGMAWTNFEACYFVLRKYYCVTDRPISKIKKYDVFENVKIGVLVCKFRKLKQEGKLSRSQIEKLENLGMTWEEKVEKTKNFAKKPEIFYYFQSESALASESGLTKPSSESDKEISPNLLHKITNLSTKGNKEPAKKKPQGKFSRIQILIDYCDETNVKLSEINEKTVYNGIKLKKKIARLQTLYQNEELSQSEIEKLNEMGICWTSRLRDDNSTTSKAAKIQRIYLTHIKPLIIYCQETGNDLSLIQFKDTYKGYNIGYSVHCLRSLRQQGRLSEDEIQELDSMNMSWSMFDIRCAVLKKFKEETHRDLSSVLYVEQYENIWIGHLIAAIRLLRKEDKLSLSQIKRLDDLGFPWIQIDRKQKGIERFEPLIQYCKETGNTLASIKQNFIYNNRNLGSLISILRREYKNGLLSDEDIALLESYGMVWSAKFTFERRIHKLKIFVENGGIIADVRYGDDLYNTLKNLRRDYREGKLTQEQIAELNTINMVWTKGKKPKDGLIT